MAFYLYDFSSKMHREKHKADLNQLTHETLGFKPLKTVKVIQEKETENARDKTRGVQRWVITNGKWYFGPEKSKQWA